MPLFVESAIRGRAQTITGRYRTAGSILEEYVKKQVTVSRHDIFLSHAYDDKELILGVALTLEDFGYSVYLDWRDDPSLNRKNVSSDTAGILRERMKASKCLLYSTSEHASESKWMPWELGFKDGNNTRVAILPVSRLQTWSYLSIRLR
jgi:hypothetical protein